MELRLWRRGWDTLAIAEKLSLPESVIYNTLWRLREHYRIAEARAAKWAISHSSST